MSIVFVDPLFLGTSNSCISIHFDQYLIQAFEYLKARKIDCEWYDSLINDQTDFENYIASIKPDLIITARSYLDYGFDKIETEVLICMDKDCSEILQNGLVDYAFWSGDFNDLYSTILGLLPPKNLFLDTLKGLSFKNKVGEVRKVEPTTHDYHLQKNEFESSFDLSEGQLRIELANDFKFEKLFRLLENESIRTYNIVVDSYYKYPENVTTLSNILDAILMKNKTTKWQFFKRAWLSAKIEKMKEQLR